MERVIELKNNWPECWGKFNEHSIGIMTPYPDQVYRIRIELKKRKMMGISVERVLNVQGWLLLSEKIDFLYFSTCSSSVMTGAGETSKMIPGTRFVKNISSQMPKSEMLATSKLNVGN